MLEISYLAKKLLDMSGEESLTVKQPSYDKPFIGICTEVTEQGMKITCVTPGTQAKKAGLQTGDIIVRMKGLDMASSEKETTKKNYFSIVENMKTDEEIKLLLLREGKRMDLVVTVGSLSHPAYELRIN